MHPLGLHLRRHLPQGRQGRGLGAAAMQYRSHDASPAGNLKGRQTESPRRRPARLDRLAWLQGTGSTRQHHPLSLATQITRAQPGRERLAVHPRQLALEPSFQVLRRYPRPLLLRLEQSHRAALENHVNRNPSMGT